MQELCFQKYRKNLTSDTASINPLSLLPNQNLARPLNRRLCCTLIHILMLNFLVIIGQAVVVVVGPLSNVNFGQAVAKVVGPLSTINFASGIGILLFLVINGLIKTSILQYLKDSIPRPYGPKLLVSVVFLILI